MESGTSGVDRRLRQYRPSEQALATSRELQARQNRCVVWMAISGITIFAGVALAQVPHLSPVIGWPVLVLAAVAIVAFFVLFVMLFWLAGRRFMNVMRDGRRQKDAMAAGRPWPDDPVVPEQLGRHHAESDANSTYLARRAQLQADRATADPTPAEQDAMLARQQRTRLTYLATGGVLWISILGMLHRDHGSGVIFYGGVLIALIIVGTIVGQLLWFRHRRRALHGELTGD